ncbi:hypothetical protein P8452_46531 [Trifolium repens]|nr:hypothetical protein P8452_46531 [Trifolium repens]
MLNSLVTCTIFILSFGGSIEQFGAFNNLIIRNQREEKTKASVRLKHAALELKLDELRKELTMFSKTKTHRKRQALFMYS